MAMNFSDKKEKQKEMTQAEERHRRRSVEGFKVSPADIFEGRQLVGSTLEQGGVWVCFQLDSHGNSGILYKIKAKKKQRHGT